MALHEEPAHSQSPELIRMSTFIRREERPAVIDAIVARSPFDPEAPDVVGTAGVKEVKDSKEKEKDDDTGKESKEKDSKESKEKESKEFDTGKEGPERQSAGLLSDGRQGYV